MSTIEFTYNQSNHWFVVAYDFKDALQICKQADLGGIQHTAPKPYCDQRRRWVVWFNEGVRDEFTQWIRTTFTVKNLEPVAGAMRSESALNYENCASSWRKEIERCTLTRIKSVMIRAIGTRDEIKELFKQYNIKVDGAANSSQYLALIEELGKLDLVVEELRKPKATAKSTNSSNNKQRATISRYSLNEVKKAMVAVIGTPAEIREFFSLYNIKVVGAAGLPQCLQLIEELNKFDAVIAELRKPKAEVPIYTPEIIEDPFDIPFECEVDMNSPEFTAFIDAAIQQMTLALPPAQAPVDFQPWTSTELTAYTVKEIKKLAELDGIDLSGTSKMKKSDLIRYILPALNSAALAAHLA
jgi:hypothetical protein